MSATSQLGLTTVEKISSANPAVLAHELVRLEEFQQGMSGMAAVGHTHGVGDVIGFEAAVFEEMGERLANSDTVTWGEVGGNLEATVRLKSGGGLKEDVDGVAADVGTASTQVAAGDHTHSQLHDPATVLDTNSIDLTVTGQQVSGVVRLKENGGLTVGTDGLSVAYGTGSGQAARGSDVETLLAKMHDPATGSSTSTLNVSVSGSQVVSGTVRLSGGGLNKAALEVDADGLYLPLGSGSAAPWTHGHDEATESAPGFMSAADKRKVDAWTQLLQADYPVGYTRGDVVQQGEYIGGRHRFGQTMEIVSAGVIAQAPVSAVILALEVDGQRLDTLTIPGGTANTEVGNFKLLSNVFVEADKYVRWVVASGIGTIENEASRVDVSMNVRSALDSAPTIRINCGGGAVAAFGLDGYFDSGDPVSQSEAVDISGVTNPAPMAVYQTRREKYGVEALNYAVNGLAKGLTYKVRLHFSSPWVQTGVIRFDILVMGKTTTADSVPDRVLYDITAEAGGANTAVVVEILQKPDNTGTLTVRLIPRLSQVIPGTYAAMVSGIEMLPVL